MNLKEAVIKKIDELVLKGEEVRGMDTSNSGFEIGEIKVFRIRSTEVVPMLFIQVRDALLPLNFAESTQIFEYLEGYYLEQQDKKAHTKREAALEYLGVS